MNTGCLSLYLGLWNKFGFDLEKKEWKVVEGVDILA